MKLKQYDLSNRRSIMLKASFSSWNPSPHSDGELLLVIMREPIPLFEYFLLTMSKNTAVSSWVSLHLSILIYPPKFPKYIYAFFFRFDYVNLIIAGSLFWDEKKTRQPFTANESLLIYPLKFYFFSSKYFLISLKNPHIMIIMIMPIGNADMMLTL